MKKMEFTATTTYKYDDDYYIDIVKINKGGSYNLSAWLYHKDYGVKDLMFGIDSPCPSEILKLAESNAEDYIRIYESEHMEGE